MAADYPTSVKSFSTKVDNVDLVMAADINDIQTEVTAIETQLIAGGVNIATATPTANAVPKALASGKLASGWMIPGWSSYTPSISYAGTPVPTSETLTHARYLILGNICFISIAIEIVAGSSVAWGIRFSYPTNGTPARTGQALSGVKNLGGWDTFPAFTDSGTIFGIVNLGSDGSLMVSGSYEI